MTKVLSNCAKGSLYFVASAISLPLFSVHNRTKILLFRWLLRLTWLPSLLFVLPFALFRKRLNSVYVFFFDRYSLGGAQKVHLDILESLEGYNKSVFFTRHSPNTVMQAAFEATPNTVCSDIHFWCDNLLIRLFSVHFWAFYLNRHKGLVLLSANSTFFYDLLPWLHADIFRIELLHNFTYGKKGMEAFGLANYAYLDLRLTVDAFTQQNIWQQYQEHQVPDHFKQRVLKIEPGVDVAPANASKQQKPLVVLYAGRSGAQKRVWLIDQIAALCYNHSLPVVFHFAGDAENDLSQLVKEKSVLHGQLSDPKQMKVLYQMAHVVILTSAYEGFPMVIKEGMANGCIPLVTALPGNTSHLREKENALLIFEVAEEDAVVREGIAQINWLLENAAARKQLSEHCHQYAVAHFSKAQFIKQYRDLLLQCSEKGAKQHHHPLDLTRIKP
ncbi:MAG: glycosyltransferase family 4 protein [Bacteroidetes bacterium]|nr:glycosyltransferase family 4 protein [Bacteroidota bacterium]